LGGEQSGFINEIGFDNAPKKKITNEAGLKSLKRMSLKIA
jgi:hypothetical protein